MIHSRTQENGTGPQSPDHTAQAVLSSGSIVAFPSEKSCSWKGRELRELARLFDTGANSIRTGGRWVGFNVLENHKGRAQKVMIHVTGRSDAVLFLSHTPDGQFVLSDSNGRRLRVRKDLHDCLNWLGAKEIAA
jgi:hypothetical protein